MKKGEIYEGVIEKVEFPNKGFVYVDGHVLNNRRILRNDSCYKS